MHDELSKFCAASVRVAAVPDEEFGEVGELCDAKVGSEGGLTAFFADDTDTDVCGLDHADIIAAVTNAGDAFLGESADEEGDVGFLGWGAAAGDDGWEADCLGDEGFAVVLEVEREGLAVDEEGGVGVVVEHAESVECSISSFQTGDGVDVLASAHELGGYGDTSCRLHFVSSQHPDLDASISQ